MKPIDSRHVTRTRIQYERAPGGGLARHALVVSTNLELSPDHVLYNPKAIEELEQTVVSYAKERGDPFAQLLFVQD